MPTSSDEVTVFLTRLSLSKSETEWNNICDEIKRHYGGYPGWWAPKVLFSGIASEVQKKWTKK